VCVVKRLKKCENSQIVSPSLRITITSTDNEGRLSAPLHLIYMYVCAVPHSLSRTTLTTSF